MIDAVIFDLYETLITEFDPHFTPRPSAAERLGADLVAFGAAWRERDERRTRGAFRDHARFLRDVCEAIGHVPDEEVILQLQRERVADKALPFRRLDPRLPRLLAGLRAFGPRTGLVTNCFGPEETAALGGSALAPLLDAVLVSCQEGFAKPEREIYVRACERLGVAPERTLYVGDGADDELFGARDAGLVPYRATWFIDCWPDWRREHEVYKRAASFPVLRAPVDLLAVPELQR